ncbi:hypothetical protein GCM10011490_24030 [Pseudoclavibacter endophyticus]|uniref:Uncharacterized protein n=1 Tax=Pseudoclavibacter endophyticus TaxID=1778590 RepID=A0A6H9WIR2_9MICO|nr:hypothetical protein [Pseudoclavibacter endophyticus]KAB1648407.1 hypothetical protein F8O04_12035 [Pseudoclavibacter endophyticus]GGA72440.1 hypothetical protein GCM10011490_24030 [Pseudoclavibacter endophyticus]
MYVDVHLEIGSLGELSRSQRVALWDLAIAETKFIFAKYRKPGYIFPTWVGGVGAHFTALRAREQLVLDAIDSIETGARFAYGPIKTGMSPCPVTAMPRVE